MHLQDLIQRLQEHPDILLRVSLDQLISFTRLATLCKASICFQVADISQPPERLPPNVHAFLCDALEQEWTVILRSWSMFRDVVWATTGVAATADDIDSFCRYGLSRGIGYRDMYPPTRVCVQPTCANYRVTNEVLTLRQPSQYDSTLFTKTEGAVPMFSHSVYCPKCHTRYHPNFYVKKTASMRPYYAGVPDISQVSQRHFFETALLELQANEMCFAWESSMNCARVYNKALRVPDSHVANNRTAFALSWVPRELPRTCGSSLYMNSCDVLDGFFLYSLLLDKAEKGGTLVLLHDASSQKLRLEPALAERNAAMEGFGQEQYAHACDLCCRVYENNDGDLVKLQAAVSDGNTLGHPCCGIHDCKVPLANTNRDLFCPVHLGQTAKCVVTTCQSTHSEGFRTCNNPTHRALELAYKEKGTAFFQLRAKIKKRGVAVPDDSTQLDVFTYDDVVTMEGDELGKSDPCILECDGKSPQGNHKIRAQFGRRRTHNEQLMIRPCGVIVSRATFFGSEAISAVRDFTLATFPTAESMPECIFYDTNCGLLKHTRKIGYHRFDKTAVVVDVFHFKSKHKESDGFCQENCNLALFPELYVDGKWVFNSSIAEQTNVWFGGFLAMVREMGAVRYNFLLDEMIKRRNRHIVGELERKGHHPWTIPIEVLFPQGVPNRAAGSQVM